MPATTVQLPVMSGFPLASLGVTTGAAGAGAGGSVGVDRLASGTRGPNAVSQAGGCSVGLIAALTLAGTGITTYICPVSVHVVVISRTTVLFRRSIIRPAMNASAEIGRASCRERVEVRA